MNSDNGVDLSAFVHLENPDVPTSGKWGPREKSVPPFQLFNSYCIQEGSYPVVIEHEVRR